MASTKAVSNFRSSAVPGKQSHLPPKGPFPIMPSSYADQSFSHVIGQKSIPKPKDCQRHQRTSSESFIMDEQPSWLDELLDEPETPLKKGTHRRSSSDSFAYMDVPKFHPKVDSLSQKEETHRVRPMLRSWGSQEFDHVRLAQQSAYFAEPDIVGSRHGKLPDSAMNLIAYTNSIPSLKDRSMHQDSGFVRKQEKEGFSHDLSEKKEVANLKASQLELDPKRAKQQYAQRSRVRKLQYIAELERNVQTLQAEGIEVSAELEFMDQQNIILSLENKALKQRLDSLTQEQLIKRLQQEVLEREIARLRALYLQQQQPSPSQQKVTPAHSRSSSRDLDSHFANLSLQSNELNFQEKQ